MNSTLEQYLVQNQTNADSILQAMRFYLAEETNDLSRDEMYQQIVKGIGSKTEVDSALRDLERDPFLLENVALSYLCDAWEQPGGQNRVISVVEDADKSLPALEIGVIAVAVMYVAYLKITRGIKEEEETIEHKPDGTFKRTKTRRLFGPTGPLSVIARILGGKAVNGDD